MTTTRLAFMTHTSYTLRWERRFGIIWIVTR
jgi:hypothetical protein